MYIPTPDRRAIHEYLFKEGVCVAKKDFNQKQHEAIPVKNLYVIKAMQSLNSKGYVKTQFSWQYYYYTLTDDGVEFLREWLHLPENVIPSTHKTTREDSFAPRSTGSRSEKVEAAQPQFN